MGGYLFDQHVQVLWDLRCQAWGARGKTNVTPSVREPSRGKTETRAVTGKWNGEEEELYRFLSGCGGSCCLFFFFSPSAHTPHTTQLDYKPRKRGRWGVTSNDLDLRNPVRVAEDYANLRRRSTLFRKFTDLLDDLFGGSLEPVFFLSVRSEGRRGREREDGPAGRSPGVWDRGRGDTLSVGVETTHFFVMFSLVFILVAFLDGGV